MCELTQEQPGAKVLTTLFAELDRELCQRYGKAQLDSKPHNQLTADAIAFVCWVQERAVGCGAYRPVPGFTDVVEIKRMFVRSCSRRRGIGAKLLDRLEQHAAQNGYQKAQLETGTSQPDAVALYERHGYQRIANFPPYTGRATSICMEKVIS